MSDKKNVPATVEPKGTEVASYQDELNAIMVATAEAEKPTGNWVSFKGGQLTIGGTPMKGNKVQAIILHSVFENQWYKNRYDPDRPESPACFALGEDDESLKPHEDSADPQAASCAECPKNQWGSDPGGGKGKACKNVRRIGMIAAADVGQALKADVAIAKLPVTSVRNWSAYAHQIANVLKLPPMAVVTEMSVEPDPKSQFQVQFALIDKVESEFLPHLLAKRRDTTPLMYTSYDKTPTQEPAGAKKY